MKDQKNQNKNKKRKRKKAEKRVLAAIKKSKVLLTFFGETYY